MQFVLYVDTMGGQLRGIPIQDQPDCSGLVDPGRCDLVFRSALSDECLLSPDIHECAAEQKRTCMQEQERKADKKRKKRIEAWLADKSNSEYGRWAYGLLA